MIHSFHSNLGKKGFVIHSFHSIWGKKGFVIHSFRSNPGKKEWKYCLHQKKDTRESQQQQHSSFLPISGRMEWTQSLSTRLDRAGSSPFAFHPTSDRKAPRCSPFPHPSKEQQHSLHPTSDTKESIPDTAEPPVSPFPPERVPPLSPPPSTSPQTPRFHPFETTFPFHRANHFETFPHTHTSLLQTLGHSHFVRPSRNPHDRLSCPARTPFQSLHGRIHRHFLHIPLYKSNSRFYRIPTSQIL